MQSAMELRCQALESLVSYNNLHRLFFLDSLKSELFIVHIAKEIEKSDLIKNKIIQRVNVSVKNLRRFAEIAAPIIHNL